MLEAWPAPGPQEQEQSLALMRRIREEIAQHDGRLPFARFMEMALYEPGLGYYHTRPNPFGEHGDFITSAQISPLFGRCLARQFAQISGQLDCFELLEFGAGDGRLARDVLLELNRLHCLPQRVSILELSPNLRALQRHTLQSLPEALRGRCHWLERWPERFTGIAYANEVLDAMPVHLFAKRGQAVYERHVSHDKNAFVWQDAEPSEPRLSAAVNALAGIDAPYVSELHFTACDWLQTASAILRQGLLLLIDYGFPRAQYYHPQRSQGTLMCHYRHRAHTDPLCLVGLQDITAHIDWTAIAEAGLHAGLELLGYTTQAHFLLNNELDSIMQSDALDEKTYWRQAQAVKKLTMPDEMGELFKVMALGRGLQGDLQGFARMDMRHKLGL